MVLNLTPDESLPLAGRSVSTPAAAAALLTGHSPPSVLSLLYLRRFTSGAQAGYINVNSNLASFGEKILQTLTF